MRWTTTEHLHLDRVATAWLISRFIDSNAEFSYLPWGSDATAADQDATPFAVPGAQLGPHDADGTCFAKVMRVYDLSEPGLIELEQAIAAGVRHAYGEDPSDDVEADVAAVGTALDILGIGFGVTSDDDAHLGRAYPVYDALYAWCQARALPPERREQIPRLPGDRSEFLRSVLRGPGADRQ